MKDDITHSTIAQPEAETAVYLFNHWFDPIAHSDDRDHLFRRIATTCSDRSRPVWRGC